MNEINLYPWRTVRDARKKQQYIVTLIIAAFSTMLSIFLHSWYYSHQIERQFKNNKYFKNACIYTNKVLLEMNAIKSQRQIMLDKLAILRELNNDRYSTLTVFNELVKLINPSVVVNTLRREKNLLKITGVAESNASITSFLQAIELSENFYAAELQEIKSSNQSNIRTLGKFNNFFELQFHQKQIRESNRSDLRQGDDNSIIDLEQQKQSAEENDSF